MREILFKAKRLDNGEWVEGDLFHNDNSSYPMTLIGSLVLSRNKYTNEIELHGYGLYEVDPETVCQYTGLKDKNGKKIFEGDIIRLWRSVGAKGDLRGKYHKPMVVKYNDLWCQFTVEDKEIKEQYGIWQAFQAFEVIGTIFDNPELLEVEE